MTSPALSVVGPVYQGEESVEPFYDEVCRAVSSLQLSYEIVLVDDGSSDGTFARMEALHRRDPAHVRVVRLSRNFGHHLAATAALDHARGEWVFLLDTDLQDDPAWLTPLWAEMQRSGADVVYGQQQQRRGLSGKLFWRIFNKLSGLPVPPNQVTARLMKRRYVDALLSLRETRRFMAGLMTWVGFHQLPIAVERRPRRFGRSTYSLTRKLSLFADAVTSFSGAPLMLAMKIGFLVTSIGLGLATYIIAQKLISPGSLVSGWASISSAVLVTGGLNMFLIGVVGTYLARVYDQVKERPSYVVMDRLEAEKEDP
jgi:putative glycosyltransferase